MKVWLVIAGGSKLLSDKKRVDEYINDLKHAITVADMSYQVWWSLSNDKNRPKYVHTMRKYNSFFRVSVHAHFVATIIPLYRLYETNGKKSTIPNFLTFLENKNFIESQTKKNFLEEIKKTKDIRKGISIIRNSVVAHRNSERIDELFKKADVKPDNLRTLIDFSKKILNELTTTIGKGLTISAIPIEDEVTELLEHLKQYNEKNI